MIFALLFIFFIVALLGSGVYFIGKREYLIGIILILLSGMVAVPFMKGLHNVMTWEEMQR